MSHDPIQHLALIAAGKVSTAAFSLLPLEQKLAELNKMTAKRRRDALLGDPQTQELIRSVPAPDFFWLVKELGVVDSSELIELASPEQITFCLDLDVWEKWTPLPNRFFDWLQAVLEGAPAKKLASIQGMDQELLVLFLKQEIEVSGGLELMGNEDEQPGSWERTFDNIYYFNFLNKEHAEQVGQLLELLCTYDQQLFVGLLEGVKAELTSDLEEVCYHFRSGRLADYSFPELTEALGVFSCIDPDSFVPSKGKDISCPPVECHFMPVPVSADDLLTRALSQASLTTQAELKMLFNCALVAEGAPFADSDDIIAICRRVRGYLNLALEQLCGHDLQRAVEILDGEYLRRLCQLGYSLVLRLRRQGESVTKEAIKVNRATERALEGIVQVHPRFYRGLDEDHADGYREFRTLADLRLLTEFLASLNNS